MRLISPEDLDLAIQAIAAGELVVLPTRRWYMICASAQDHEACDRIFAGKNRPRTKSLVYVLPHLTAANDLFTMTPGAHRLAAAFWPGELAMILPWRDTDHGHQHESVGAPNALVTMDPGPLGDLALRSPVPIAATTANISVPRDTDSPGPAITTAEVQQFSAEAELDIAYCVDGGICPLGNHLTIVDCTGDLPHLVRPGLVHERAVIAAVPAVVPQHPR